MAKKLFTLSLLLLFTVCSFSMPTATRKQIELHVEKEIIHRSISPICPMQASIDNSLLEIKTECPIDKLTVAIRNTATGNIVYHDTQMNAQTLTIDLSGEDKDAQYVIELSTENGRLIKGEFTLN